MRNLNKLIKDSIRKTDKLEQTQKRRTEMSNRKWTMVTGIGCLIACLACPSHARLQESNRCESDTTAISGDDLPVDNSQDIFAHICDTHRKTPKDSLTAYTPDGKKLSGTTKYTLYIYKGRKVMKQRDRR